MNIKNFLKPKNKNEIDKELFKLSDDLILEKSLKYNYADGIKSILDKGLSKKQINTIRHYIYNLDINNLIILSNSNKINKNIRNDIYVVEKYKFNIHQDDITNYEQWAENILMKLKADHVNMEGCDIIIYKLDNRWLSYFDGFNNNFYYDKTIGDVLVKQFGVNEYYTDVIVKHIASKTLNLKINDCRMLYLSNKTGMLYLYYKITKSSIKYLFHKSYLFLLNILIYCKHIIKK